MPKLRYLLAALLVGLMVGSAAPVYTQGPYAAQIQAALRGFLAGAQTFTGNPIIFTGNVGIGAAPSFTLHVKKSSNVFGDVLTRLENTNTGNGAFSVLDVTAGTNNIRIYTPSQGVALQAGHLTTSGTMSMYFGIGNQDNWGIEGTTGHLIAVTDNTWDIGKLAATRPRNLYLAGTYWTPVGSGMAVANVGANSCGTTAATIAGNNNVFTITVGAGAGTQCRVAFTVTAPTVWGCTVTDETTTIATRATPVDTTHVDFLGAFVAGDKVTGVCFPR